MVLALLVVGLVDQLGFSYRDQHAIQRGVIRFVSTDFGIWLGKWLLAWIDRLVFRITAGGNTATNWAAGLPMIWLETTGRRTGKTRRHALLAFPIDGELALIGSNFGRDHHPAWALNLEANPQARLEFEDEVVMVRAHRAAGDQVDRIWEIAADRYPGYARYRERVTTREIKLFILERDE